MFEALIFDFDGVILDSEPLHYEACCRVFNPLGITLSYEEYVQKYIGTCDKDTFPELLKSNGHLFTAQEINALIKQKVDSYIHIITHRNPLPMIKDLDNYLFSVKKSIRKMAICSGSTRHEIQFALEKLYQGKLQSAFDCIVTSEDVTSGKPSPEGYLLTAKELGVPAGKCLVIEDSPHGIHAAKSAGMHVIGLCTSYTPDDLSQADRIVSGYHELLQVDG